MTRPAESITQRRMLNPLSVRLSIAFLSFVILLAIIGPLIANEKPYYCVLDGKSYYPLFSGVNESTLSNLHPDHSPVDWKETDFEKVMYAPVPYSHFSIDLKTGRHVSPLDVQHQSTRFRHWLGTDLIGRDVLAGLIRGCRISLLVGFGSMLLALLIGIPLGSLSAYWGNKGIRISFIQIVLLMLILIAAFYALSISLWLSNTMVLVILIFFLFIFTLLYFGRSFGKKSGFPVDSFVLAGVSIIDALPGLFIVLLVLVIVPVQGWLIVTMIIGLIRWPVIARYMRAEVYKMKESNYIKAAQVLNIPTSRILMQHIIPYAFRPVMISFIFGIASAILAESSLSFLGIGIPVEELNWGKLLSQSRNHFDAWWLVLFPGAAIFFTLLSLYTVGNALENAWSKGHGAWGREHRA